MRKILLISMVSVAAFGAGAAIIARQQTGERSPAAEAPAVDFVRPGDPIGSQDPNSGRIQPPQAVSALPQVVHGAAELQRESASPWAIQADRSGRRAQVLRGGRLQIAGANLRERSENFLRRYGPGLLGVDPDQLRMQREDGGEQLRSVHYEQWLRGARLYSTKLSLFFNAEGELVHVVNDTKPAGSAVPDVSVSRAQAESVNQAALAALYQEAGINGAQLNESGYELVTFNSGSMLVPAHRFITQLSAPFVGDYEVLVSAVTGTVLIERNLARR